MRFNQFDRKPIPGGYGGNREVGGAYSGDLPELPDGVTMRCRVCVEGKKDVFILTGYNRALQTCTVMPESDYLKYRDLGKNEDIAFSQLVPFKE